MTNSSEVLQAYLYRALNVNRGLDIAETLTDNKKASTIASFSETARAQARFMGDVYELLYCLENSIRELVESTLRELLGADKWWTDGVSQQIRKAAEKRRDDDAKARWHGPRGASLLAYVDFPQYADIILGKWCRLPP